MASVAYAMVALILLLDFGKRYLKVRRAGSGPQNCHIWRPEGALVIC